MKTRTSEKHREAREMVPAWLLLEWLQDQGRAPAAVAFTEGPLRDIALAAEGAMLQRGDADAMRYRTLRSGLLGGGAAMACPPFVAADWAFAKTYTPDGLDAVLDARRRLEWTPTCQPPAPR